MEDIGIFGILVLVLAGSIVLFLLLREYFCWYWKINEIKDLLSKINDNLQNIKPAESDSINEQKIISSSNTVEQNENREMEPEAGLSSPLLNNQVRIVRKKNDFGANLSLNVRLDDQTFQLENGEEKITDNIGNGVHTISTSFNSENDKLEFTIDNDSKTISIFTGPPLKIEVV